VSGWVDAIVLAGQRKGEDPFASAQGAPHRALVPVGGQPMLNRVLATLDQHPRVGSIRVSIDQPALIDPPNVVTLQAASSPSQSALEALDALPQTSPRRPTLLTTADHALLDAPILDAFLRGAEDSGADIAVGFVEERRLKAAYPQSQRTYLHFRGGAYSGANLFALQTPAARRAIEFWRQIEQHRKRPWRLVSAFGFSTLVRFALRRLSLDEGFERASEVLGLRARPVLLPFPHAAIDVDKPADLALVERILRDRASAP
jgi:GTP:adenosylcobinamide-phosphate guanylyltransferase